jgi:hypothetical protein
MALKVLIRLQRTSAITYSRQQLDEAPDSAFIRVRQLYGSSRKADGSGDVALKLAPFGSNARRARRRSSEPCPLALQPTLKRRYVVEEETGKEVTAIKLERSVSLLRGGLFLERHGVTPHSVEVDGDLFVSARKQRSFAKRMTQHMQSIP